MSPRSDSKNATINGRLTTWMELCMCFKCERTNEATERGWPSWMRYADRSVCEGSEEEELDEALFCSGCACLGRDDAEEEEETDDDDK